ncbi:MAG: bifunctional methylenetetrahydrofolate dehydrogenase/methenyltetrahydrofolate cyclohydrolase FolD [Candidatus Eisenbacteria bacterium]|nr:bifunctional methylenetetrahydrofolate dehydrogenase/methenyltetrahydrofolate cyclohydrolase FolD [Candidatus Eisenbacteria bacterium]
MERDGAPEAVREGPRRISGRKTARKIRELVAAAVAARPAGSAPPALAVVRVGDDPASVVYVNNKEKACREAGMGSRQHVLDAGAGRREVLQILQQLNEDPEVDGILVQLPVPPQLEPRELQEAILPAKDVDGLHPLNAGRLAQGAPFLIPCTPLGILVLLEDHGIAVAGRRVVIVGRSAIVGRPLAQLMSQKGTDATVTVAHSRTPELGSVTREAEILVAAAGRPGFITGEMVREGAVVVDVGIHRVGESAAGKPLLAGDVDATSVAPRAAAMTPVPGGVGPMTIALLLANTLWAAQVRREWPAPRPPWRLGEGLV